MVPQRREQPLDAGAVSLLNDIFERLAPLALFERFQLGGVRGCDFLHL
jgi:hypothetical protein